MVSRQRKKILTFWPPRTMPRPFEKKKFFWSRTHCRTRPPMVHPDPPGPCPGHGLSIWEKKIFWSRNPCRTRPPTTFPSLLVPFPTDFPSIWAKKIFWSRIPCRTRPPTTFPSLLVPFPTDFPSIWAKKNFWSRNPCRTRPKLYLTFGPNPGEIQPKKSKFKIQKFLSQNNLHKNTTLQPKYFFKILTRKIFFDGENWAKKIIFRFRGSKLTYHSLKWLLRRVH